jgi:phage terminase small subunit
VRLAKHPEIQEALARARDEKARIQAEATQLAIERSAITMERVAVELGRIGFANMMDYMKIDPATGDPRLDWSDLTREQAAALTEVTVDDYVDGRGENARDVRKVRFKLGDKRASLMDIAKLFGWIVERRENKIVNEFDSMSTEEVEAWLDAQAEARVKVRHGASAEVQRRGGIVTLRPATTARGKPH